MELEEMQNIWSRYDNHIVEQNRLNRDILRQMLKAKPEKRIERYRKKFAFTFITGIAIMVYFFTTTTFARMVRFADYADDVLFWIAGGVITVFMCVAIYSNYRYWSLINSLDMSDPVERIREKLARIQAFLQKSFLSRYIMAPAAAAAILYVSGFKFSNKDSVVFCIVFIVVMLVSSIKAKKRIAEEFRGFNSELDELEKIERE